MDKGENLNKDLVSASKFLVDCKTEDFEDMILACAMHDKEFMSSIVDTVCCGDNNQHVEDFNSPRNNAIYEAIKIIHKFASDPSDRFVFENIINSFAESGKHLEVGLVPTAMEDFDRIHSIKYLSVLPLVKEGLGRWLSKIRVLTAHRLSLQKGINWDPETYYNASLEAHNTVSSLSKKIKGEDSNVFFSVGSSVDNVEADIERIPMNFGATGRLSHAIGGGLGKGESMLFVAPSGGGKTVVACQMASDMTITSKAKGLLITTEEHPLRLDKRILSARLSISFDLIKDGVHKKSLTSLQIKQLEELTPMLENLQMVDWSTNPQEISPESNDVDDLIKRAQDQMGGLDYVILDWIGNALAQNTNKNIREDTIYSKAAEKMTMVAKQHNVATVSFAQVAHNTPPNTVYIRARDIAESKSMVRSMSVVAGLSAVPIDGADHQQQGQNFDPIQMINIFKNRMHTPSFFRVWRDYGLQRLMLPDDRRH